MSVQAGIWNFDGKPVDRILLSKFSEALRQQGTDGQFCYLEGSIALLYRPFHTTAESRRESQPYVSPRGFVITWDGRLDNGEELAADLGRDVKGDATDVDLFGTAFDRWESECFRRIIGDWAVSIWKPRERELIFACDFMAIRHIFYYLKSDRIWWSTDLTPLVLLSGDKFHIDDEYIAGYFAHEPDAHLTPYREIRQVPPGQFVRVRNNTCHIERYWKFSPKSRIRYKSDAEYEEHFRHVFRQSVRRRLRSDSPILAELSGGLDSSSIVCMANDILTKEGAQTPCVDTLSYYDKTEPGADDLTFFQKVEAYLGRAGHHIDASTLGTVPASVELPEFSALPGHLGVGQILEAERALIVRKGGYRAVLSGIGGDEFLGGVPNPNAQLADLVVQCRPLKLAQQLIAWSLIKRRPWIHILWGVAVDLLPPSIGQHFAKLAKVEPWIDRNFSKRTKLALRLIATGEHFGMRLPTRRSYVGGVLLMANRLAKWKPLTMQLEESRFPYLDQRLIEFILSIPATQLLRPGERRSLMRRSLLGLVPQDILSRQTKQFGARAPLVGLDRNWHQIQMAFDSPLSSRLGYLNRSCLLEKLRVARSGKQIAIARMLRTISLEFWLRDLASRGLIGDLSAPSLPNVGNAFGSHQVVPEVRKFHHSC